jgi:hypothetical protein
MFDIQAAKNEGYSDEDIAGYLSKSRNYDLPGAIKEGYSHKQVIDYLSKSPSETVPSPKKEKSAEEFVDPTIALVPGFTAGKKLEEMEFPKKFVPGELWDISKTEAAGGLERNLGFLSGLVPFKEQIEGKKEWLSPDTAMEIAGLYAAGKAIPTVAKPIANKIRTLLRLPTKREIVPEMLKIISKKRGDEIWDWVDSIAEKEVPEVKPLEPLPPTPRPNEAMLVPPERIPPAIEPVPLKPEQLRYRAEINELRDIVLRAEPGRRIADAETGEQVAWGSSFPPGLSGKGYSKADIIQTIDKGMESQPLTERQQGIFDTVKRTANSMYREKVRLAQVEKIQPIKTGELEVGDKIKVHGETLKVTEKTPEGIVIKDGQEYKLDPYFDTIEGKRIGVRPSVEQLETVVKGGQVGPLPKYAEGSAINLEKIDTTDDVKHLLNNLTSDIEGDIGKHPISWEETRRQWVEQGLDANTLVKRFNRKQSFTAAEIDAVRTLNSDAIVQLHNKIRNLPYDKTQWDPNIRADLMDTLDLVRTTSQAASEAGRALNIHKRVLTEPGLSEQERFGRAITAISKKKGTTIEDIRLMNVLSKKGAARTDDIISSLKNVDFSDPSAVNDFVYKTTVAPWQRLSDKAFEIWINLLLSGPKTHLVYATSHALTAAESYPENVLSQAIESIRVPAAKVFPSLGEPVRERFFGENKEMLFSMSKAIQDANRKFVDVWKSGGEAFRWEERPSAFPLKAKRFLPTTSLGAMRAWFKTFLQSQSLSQFAYRAAAKEGITGEALRDTITELLEKGTPELLEAAAKKADVYTFQEELGKIGQVFVQARDVPGIRYFIPFVKTPFNIAKFALERTPLNIPRIVLKATKGELKGGALSDEAAKILFGSMVGFGTYLSAKAGLITGSGPKEKNQQDNLRSMGWQPYSLKIGDTYYSYGRLEPAASIVGIAADFAELEHSMNEDEKMNVAARLGGSIAKNITSKSFVMGFSQLTDAISDPERHGEKLFQGLAGSIIPAASYGATQATDPYYRKARSILDIVKSRIPLLSEEVPPRFNAWGEPMERPGEPIVRALSPVQVSEVKVSPADAELARLKLGFNLPSRKIGGLELTEGEYESMLQDGGAKAKAKVTNLVKGDWYKGLNDESKKNEIKKAMMEAHAGAREKLIITLPQERRVEIKKKK